MDDTIFSKIIRGDIPSLKIYEDDRAFAFLDIHPIQTGMVLVVAKNPVDHFMDLPDDDYHALMAAVKLVAKKMHTMFPGKRIGVAIEGFEVPHAHVKLFPISNGPEFRAEPPSEEANHAELAAIAKKLKIS